MKTTTNTTKTINYTALPHAMRLVIAKEVVQRIANGEAPDKVAKEFGANIALVNSWLKRDSEGTLDKHYHATKVVDRIDARHMSNDDRMSLRQKAKDMRKTTGIAQTARALGVAQLTIRRCDESEAETYHKRGRKFKMINIRTVTDDVRIELNTKALEMHKNGQNIDAISESLRINKLLITRWIKLGVVTGKRGRKARMEVETTTEVSTEVQA